MRQFNGSGPWKFIKGKNFKKKVVDEIQENNRIYI